MGSNSKSTKKNNLIVRKSLYHDHTLVAVSRMNGDFLNKSRVKVVARIVENEEGYLEPAIRVLNQWDKSDAKVWGRPSHQAGYKWINLSTNSSMEARLYNEVQKELGINNSYSGKAWKPVSKGKKNPI